MFPLAKMIVMGKTKCLPMVKGATVKRAIINFDGASKGNPGAAGWGFVIRDTPDGPIIHRGCGEMGKATNNEAEYEGCIRALEKAKSEGYTEVLVRGDSALIIGQVSGGWKVKSPNLMPYHTRALIAYQSFPDRAMEKVPRKYNGDADALAVAAATATATATATTD